MATCECPLCGGDISIKDNGIYSSAMCNCRIIIWYYREGNHCEISKKSYLDYKKNQRALKR